jgi:hypothetical protein
MNLKKIPENAVKVPGMPGNKSGFWTPWTPFPVFPESLNKETVQKKDPGNRKNGVHGARVCTSIFSDIIVRPVCHAVRVSSSGLPVLPSPEIFQPPLRPLKNLLVPESGYTPYPGY